jgi:hypothetical protein
MADELLSGTRHNGGINPSALYKRTTPGQGRLVPCGPPLVGPQVIPAALYGLIFPRLNRNLDMASR